MNYEIIIRPVGATGLSATRVADTDRKIYTERRDTILASGRADDIATLVSQAAYRRNNFLVAMAAVGNTVQPSTAQQGGLISYLAAIQAGTNTGAVETAINAL